ncbi:hypothetical protein [Vibrio campbellii]|uniref:hypothetical protein n=1 Tax=Vibrio campbellii TaxID=680 RepID=UPI0020A5D340|nr:hypothetical protein [Vibrio campbellii]
MGVNVSPVKLWLEGSVFISPTAIGALIKSGSESTAIHFLVIFCAISFATVKVMNTQKGTALVPFYFCHFVADDEWNLVVPSQATSTNK